MKTRKLLSLCGAFCALLGIAAAQAPPAAITLEDALARSRQYAGQLQDANYAVLQAQQDTLQVRAARLPAVNAFNQFLYTEGNGTPAGVFVANNGVHVYSEQAVVHEEALAYLRHGEVNRALAAEAVARARVDVARRGLSATVVQNYFAIVLAERHRNNATIAVSEAQRFYDITRQQEQGGEVAHSDVLRAQIDLQQRQRDLQEAEIGIEKAKIGLGVLIFPNFSAGFSIIDDVQQASLLPPVEEAQSQAVASSPELKASSASVQQAGHEITIARYGYLPSLGLDFFYGINANQFAFRTRYPGEPGYLQNLGYSAQATLDIPVWNWGATRSKIKQAELRRDQAQLGLSLNQRALQANLAGLYAEARVALAQIESLRSSVDITTENLRLVLLRYQSGEATALEVVDAQNIVTIARNAYDDGLTRYRVALSTLQILTGVL